MGPLGGEVEPVSLRGVSQKPELTCAGWNDVDAQKSTFFSKTTQKKLADARKLASIEMSGGPALREFNHVFKAVQGALPTDLGVLTHHEFEEALSGEADANSSGMRFVVGRDNMGQRTLCMSASSTPTGAVGSPAIGTAFPTAYSSAFGT